MHEFKLEKWREGSDSYKLSVTNQNISGVVVSFVLDGPDLWRLHRLGQEVLQFTNTNDMVGSIAVSVVLPYSDVDKDQDTPSYTWEVVVADIELAKQIGAVIPAELKGSVFEDQEATIEPYVAYGCGSKAVTSVQEAIADLRLALYTHQSNSVKDDLAFADVGDHGNNYWKSRGFTTAEITGLDCIDFEGNNACNGGGPLLEQAEGFEQDNHDDESDTPAWIKFKKWAAGE